MKARKSWFGGVAAAVLCMMAGAVPAWAQSPSTSGERWFRGNTHTHTWFSDGASPPEMVVDWYKGHGYQFLVLTDHNARSDTATWKAADGKRAKAIEAYEKSGDAERIEKRKKDDATEYRLVPIGELARRYDEPGRFVLIPGEEISTSSQKRPVHMTAVNLKESLTAEKADTVPETIRRNMAAVAAQREKTGQVMLLPVCHPNFVWGVTAEEIAEVKEARLFEVYNGHGGVRNYGDDLHASTERMWDIILTLRLAEMGGPILYGMASDDAHAYPWTGGGNSPPGRGWIMVRAKSLTPAEIVSAMERGDFYATTGVVLDRVSFEDGTLAIEIAARPGVSYKTQFIGTLTGYDRTVVPQKDSKGVSVTGKYSDDVGKVLAEQAGSRASYKLTGKEIYVRAKVISSAKHPNPHAPGDFEVAWVQPVQPTSRPAASR